MGTVPGDACATTAIANDEAGPDPWPMDFNDDQHITGPDVLKYAKPVFGSMPPRPPYDIRYDLNANGRITGPDILKFGPFFGKSCTP